jgi:hypothetical protein
MRTAQLFSTAVEPPKEERRRTRKGVIQEEGLFSVQTTQAITYM